MAAHLERGSRRGIGALAALLQSPVQVRGDRSEGPLAFVFTMFLWLGDAPVGRRCSDVLQSMGWVRHAFS